MGIDLYMAHDDYIDMSIHVSVAGDNLEYKYNYIHVLAGVWKGAMNGAGEYPNHNREAIPPGFQ